jgi:hypothetical protein
VAKRFFEKAVQSIRVCRDGANRADGNPPATSVNGRVSRIRYGFRQPTSINERPLPRDAHPMQLAYRSAL